MNLWTDPRWLIFLLGTAFGAGGYVFALISARKQINGLGARVNHEAATNRQRYLRLSLAMVQLAPEEKRERIAGILLEEKSEG